MAGRRTWGQWAKRTAKRAGKLAVGLAKKRYLGKGGMKNVVRDVARLKSLVNVEKKHFKYANATASPLAIGQVNGNSNAGAYLDTTPLPTQGVTYSTRNGASIKLTSQYYRFQFAQQSATTSPIKVIIQLYKVVGAANNINVGVAQGEIFEANQFNGLVDFNATRNPDYFRDYKLLKTKVFTMPADPLASTTMIKEIQFGMRYKNHHVRFSKDSQLVTAGQIIMCVRVDAGNCSTTTAYTGAASIPITVINSGLTMQWAVDSYFIDN